jgi:transcriptional regulator with XRE-family HTH domain
MKDRIEKIKQERKLKGLKWNDLAEGLPVTGEAVRVAFYRNSIDPLYLEKIEENLGLRERTISTVKNDETMDRFEVVVALKVIEYFKPYIDGFSKSHETLLKEIVKIRLDLDDSEDNNEEIIERLNRIENTVKKTIEKL